MKLKELVDKLMIDRVFYKKLKKDPAAALRGQGEEPTPKQIEALKKIDYKSLEAVATAFADKLT